MSGWLEDRGNLCKHMFDVIPVRVTGGLRRRSFGSGSPKEIWLNRPLILHKHENWAKDEEKQTYSPRGPQTTKWNYEKTTVDEMMREDGEDMRMTHARLDNVVGREKIPKAETASPGGRAILDADGSAPKACRRGSPKANEEARDGLYVDEMQVGEIGEVI